MDAINALVFMAPKISERWTKLPKADGPKESWLPWDQGESRLQPLGYKISNTQQFE